MPKVGDGNIHTELFYQRVDAVGSIILQNEKYLYSKRSAELVRIIKQELGCSKRTAQKYIAEAKKDIRKLTTQNKQQAFEKAVLHREFLLTKTKTGKSADLKLALEIMKDIAKIYGLYADEIKHSGEMTVKNINLKELTDYGLERLSRGDKIEEIFMDPKCRKVE